MKGVILAAGTGTRLKSLTREHPKPLVSIRGRPLIDYTIEAFVQAGFTRLGVVVGHKAHLLRHYLGDGSRYGIRIQCLPNEHYWRGNATSILASQPFAQNESFVVSMADHMISADILKRLLACAGRDHMLCVDWRAHAPPQINDATKVWVDERGFVVHIGKELARWNAIDTGVFLFTPRIFHHILTCLHDGLCSITRTVLWMIATGDPLGTCDVSGTFWLDVDTPDDLQYACAALRRRAQAAAEGRKGHASSDYGSSASGGRSAGPPTGVWSTPPSPPVAGPEDVRLATDDPDRSVSGSAARRVGHRRLDRAGCSGELPDNTA
jgi:choline kinase